MSTKSLGQLTIDVIAQVGGFVDGMSAAERSSAKWQKQVERNVDAAAKKFKWGAGIAAAAMTYWVKTSLDSAAELDNLIKVANSSATEFQRFAAGSKSVGIENEKLSDILKDVNDRVGDFLSTGGGPMADFFEKIAPLVGVTVDNFRDLSGPQALGLYVDSLQKAGLSQQEMTFYMEAMAGDATALIPLLIDNGKEMKALGDRAEALGLILSDDAVKGAKQFKDDLALLGDIASSTGTQIGVELLPEINDLTEILSDPETVQAAADFAKGVAGAFADIVTAARDTVKFVRWVGEETAVLLNGIDLFDKVRIDRDIDKIQALLSDKSLFGKLDRIRIFGPKGVVEYWNEEELRAEMARLKARSEQLALDWTPAPTTEPKAEDSPAKIRRKVLFDWKEHDEFLDKFIENSDKQLEYQMELNQKMLDEDEELQERLAENNDLRLQQQIDDSESFWDKYLEAAQEALENVDDLALSTIETFSSGMGSALESIIFDFQSLGDAFDTVVESMARNMINALGKMAAEWLVYQAVQLLVGKTTASSGAIAMASNAQAASFQAGINAFSSTAAIPIVGPAAAPAAMAAALGATQPLASSVAALAASSFAGAFDKGGDIPAGMFGLVGERGPELVSGPMHVTGREKTAAVFDRMAKDKAEMRAASDAPPPMNVRIINVKSEKEILDALGSDAGEKVILNAAGRNSDFFRKLSNG